MDPYAVDAAECLRLLGDSDDGLPAREVERRRGRDGWNELPERRARPVAFMLARQFTHLFALILWVAATLCFISAWGQPASQMATLGTAIVAVIVVNGVFSFAQEYRADRAVAALRRLLPLRVRARRDGATVELPARELVAGDVIFLQTGDQVPADCRVLASTSLRVNTATLTGEAVPEWRDDRPSADTDPLRRRNALLAGTFVVSGRARAIVIATGTATQFGRVAAAAQSRGPALSPLQKEVERLARVIAVLASALGVAFLLAARAIGISIEDDLLFAVGVIVANVPEGLLPCITLSLAMASQRMARRNALVRRLPAVEALGCATVICTDKTGTLTQNRMQVRALFLAGRQVEADPVALCSWARRSPSLFEGAALCHGLVQGQEGGKLGDPMEIALAEMGEAALGGMPPAVRVGEAPFDADRRRQSTLHRIAGNLVLHAKGALDALLPLCARAEMDGGTRELTASLRAVFLEQEEAMAAAGLRVLAVARAVVSTEADPSTLERDLTLCGLVGLEDPPRPEASSAVDVCRQAGIRVIMVTGDHPRTALAVARQVGLVRGTPRLLTGVESRALDDVALRQVLRAPEIVVARADPMDKRRIVAALRETGEIVAVTGDGANDAPALREADIGVAMGLSGTDVAREAADLVLLDDNFATIVSAVEEGRAVYANARKFLTYILTSNVPELVPYLAFVLLRAPLALTLLQILAVDLGTDMVPALALGAEPPAAAIMQRAPRRPGERLADARVLLRAYGFLGPLEAGAAMTAFFLYLSHHGWRWNEPLAPSDSLYLQATTVCLVAIVFAQVGNLFVCRSESAPLWARGLRRNKLLAAGILVELALIVLIAESRPGNTLFATAPLPLAAWLSTIPLAAAFVVIEEARKMFVRRSHRRNAVLSSPATA